MPNRAELSSARFVVSLQQEGYNYVTMPDLFDGNIEGMEPLAERMRPRDFADFFGQEEIVGKGKPLRSTIENDDLRSVILWGPPGSGKTTLARIIAEKTKAFFRPFSAATSGVPELRKIIEEATRRLKFEKRKTILFVDEIHRFNKAQQDAFLPSVENGTIILIGATTENPSFEINSPLLSRSLVLVLKPLTDGALGKIIRRALTDGDYGLGKRGAKLDPDAMQVLIGFADGDARVALNALEFIVLSAPDILFSNSRELENKTMDKSATKDVKITTKMVEEALQKKAIRYDKNGEEHYNVISAFIKSMRDSDPDGALYWLARMIEGGENPRFIARRMIVFASEDIGNALPTALVVAIAVAEAVEHVGMPEAGINLAHGATYLASAPKSNASYKGLLAALEDAKEHGALPVPLHLRNAVTNLMKELGYHKGYKYAHDFKNAKVDQQHLPDKLKGSKYYRPPSAGGTKMQLLKKRGSKNA
ncbi:MAG: Replication-associated recombination protein A [Parcubacteria group bacterium GW2011_GWB1_52_7]|nr:MAG: Replication-associated recombination protein A [Parcubacteria group bacterium GW2011_GWB1_52_7]KKW31768.1 MAG: Replication-associated recombination protein A [Parcubacteria group bacterium GW2011_GWC2_52_8c]